MQEAIWKRDVSGALRRHRLAPKVSTMMEKPPAKRALEAGPAPTAPIAPWRISKKVQTAIGFHGQRRLQEDS
jgi:hypothetical protein